MGRTERYTGFAASGWPPGVAVLGKNGAANLATFLWHCSVNQRRGQRERVDREQKLMPVNFLQKQEARRQDPPTEGQFGRSGAAAVQGGLVERQNYNRKLNLLLIRCRLHIREYSMQLLIVAADSQRHADAR
jgi:hypothetical protein